MLSVFGVEDLKDREFGHVEAVKGLVLDGCVGVLWLMHYGGFRKFFGEIDFCEIKFIYYSSFFFRTEGLMMKFIYNAISSNLI